MTGPVDEDGDVAAAELALGLLGGEERQAAEARLAEDPAFAAAHARWVDRTLTLLPDGGEAVRPSLWQSIEAKLPANDLAAPARSGAAWPWKAATFGSSLVAAGLLAVIALHHPAPSVIVRQSPPTIVTRRPPPEVIVETPAARPAAQPLLAVLTGSKSGVALAISLDRANGRIDLAAAKLDLGKKVPELWVIPAGGSPRAIGVIPVTLAGSLKVPAEVAALVRPGATLAISKEPEGGSSTGQPTGPVILTGTIAAS